MTIHQARVYTKKVDGVDGVEGIYEASNTQSVMRARRSYLKPSVDKAVGNLMSGRRWDWKG